jgi:hypothetical protein
VTEPDPRVLAITERAHDRFNEVEDNLAQIPRFMQALKDTSKAPAKMLLCPNHHDLLEVTLECDHNWHPYLVATSDVGRAVVEDGWANLFPSVNPDSAESDPEPTKEAIAMRRVKLKCPECRYSPTLKQETLLGFYALALQTNKRTIHLLT